MAEGRGADILVSAIDALSIGVAALIGFAMGAVFAGVHAALPPWSLALGLIAIAALLIGYRLAFGVRRHAIGGAVGVIVAVALFTLEGQGGTVLVANDVFGWTWVLAAPLVAALAVALPFRNSGSRGADVAEVAD